MAERRTIHLVLGVEGRTPKQLAAAAARTGAVVVDTRALPDLGPRAWQLRRLERLLGDDYKWIRQLDGQGFRLRHILTEANRGAWHAQLGEGFAALAATGRDAVVFPGATPLDREHLPQLAATLGELGLHVRPLDWPPPPR